MKEDECIECGEELTEDDDADPDGSMCNYCTDQFADYEPRSFNDFEPNFADPGGRSALRAATEDNPRNLPCPTCGEPNRLTPADKSLGYQCDYCADAAEQGM